MFCNHGVVQQWNMYFHQETSIYIHILCSRDILTRLSYEVGMALKLDNHLKQFSNPPFLNTGDRPEWSNIIEGTV